MNTKETFANRFSELCGDRSQAEIANEIGIARATVGYYRSGDRSPDVTTLFKIAQYFGVTSDYLIGLSDAKQSENSNIVERLKLSEKTIEYIEMSAATEVSGNLSFEDRLRFGAPQRSELIDQMILCMFVFNVFNALDDLCFSISRIPKQKFNSKYLSDGRNIKIFRPELVEISENASKYGCEIIDCFEHIDLLRNRLNDAVDKAVNACVGRYKLELHRYKDDAEEESWQRLRSILNEISGNGEPDGDD